ncbi:MAG: hypothetical protein BGP06_17295 [Rhizobiales bacterium 65-9]|nr:MAG: hypothetical protein BGP06_17295 [Rhizobiales bacterium 65-9]
MAAWRIEYLAQCRIQLQDLPEPDDFRIVNACRTAAEKLPTAIVVMKCEQCRRFAPKHRAIDNDSETKGEMAAF